MSKDNQGNKNIVRERPLSPHLTIYNPQISSVLSISHRITGLYLILSAIVFSWLLISIACGPVIFGITQYYLTTKFGYTFLFFWTVAAFYHLFNGIRHLFWDIGFGFKIRNMEISGYLVLLGVAVSVVTSWYFILGNTD